MNASAASSLVCSIFHAIVLQVPHDSSLKSPFVYSQVHSSAEAKSSVFLAAECLNNKLPEDSEIDALYDDIAGVSEPIYEELSNTNVTSKHPVCNFPFETSSALREY